MEGEMELNDLWQKVLLSIKKCKNVPRKVKELLPGRVPAEEDWEADDGGEYSIKIAITDDGYIYIKAETMDETYIDFLKIQIGLCPRGLEWNRVLEHRLRAYEKNVGKLMFSVSIQRENKGPNTAITVLAEAPYNVLLVETYEYVYE